MGNRVEVARSEELKKYKGYLIDLDGTTYYGTRRIPSAEAFIHRLNQRNDAYVFLTNNATRTPQEIVNHLKNNYDLPVSQENVYSSTEALLSYMKENFRDKNIFVVGERALHYQVKQAGFRIVNDAQADVVVQGLNRQTNYEELATAAMAIRNGAAFLVTNADQTIPTEKGIMPSSGAITAFLEVASGKQALVAGKPNPLIVEAALKKLNLSANEVLLIGDKYETDILAGLKAGVDTLLVLTGVTQAEEVAQLPTPPTYVLNDLSEWEFN